MEIAVFALHPLADHARGDFLGWLDRVYTPQHSELQ